MTWLVLLVSPALAFTPHWRDHDLDGYGDPWWPVLPTHPRAVPNALDCNDYDPNVSPAATEVCDRIDNDCNWLVDDDDPWRDPTSARVFYIDNDLDSAGDSSMVLVACALPPGWSPEDTDCDDSDRTSHPRARELCDGVDNDCDGLVDDDDPDVYRSDYVPMWSDDDSDGFGNLFGSLLPTCAAPGPGHVANYEDCDDTTAAIPRDDDGDGFGECNGDCNDGDPGLGPGAFEACDGVDGDCDGHDDLPTGYTGDQALLGCDLCPSAHDYDEQVIRIDTYNPCVLDPAATWKCEPTDTHSVGYRLHRVAVRTDLADQREPLVVYLSDDAGREDTAWIRWAAWAGLDAISLGWANEIDGDCGWNAWCLQDARNEAMDGTNASPYANVSPEDSIEGRLATLLAHLDTEDPTRGWGNHLVGGAVDWSTVILVGWDLGADQASYVAQQHALHGLIMLSGPGAAGWEYAPWATDPCRMWGVYHTDETQAARDMYEFQLWFMGLWGSTITVDDWHHYPWNTHVMTWSSPAPSLSCSPSDTLADDTCVIPERGMQAALDLLCLATEVDPTCP